MILTQEILSDLKTLRSRTSGITWKQGSSSHETVATTSNGKRLDYHVANFRHADDASFVDNAHKYMPFLIEEIETLRKQLDTVRGCFHAAEVEGLTAALAETTDERLKDLVQRRLLHAYYAAKE